MFSSFATSNRTEPAAHTRALRVCFGHYVKILASDAHNMRTRAGTAKIALTGKEPEPYRTLVSKFRNVYLTVGGAQYRVSRAPREA